MQPKRLIGYDTFHLPLDEGMDHTFKFIYTDESTLLPINLTGYRADLYVRMVPGSTQVLKGLSTSYSYADGSITLGANGEITLKITGGFTTNLNWSSGIYDLVLTDPNQNRSKILKGFVNIYNTNTFPLEYSPIQPDDALVLTSGKTLLPNGIDLYGYMNPIKLGIGGGLLLTGSLRPAIYMGHEVVELSYTGGSLRVTFSGNMPSSNVFSMKIGTQVFPVSTSEGRVFNESGAAGLGLTYWEWRGLLNPFGDVEGWAVAVTFTPEADPDLVIDGGTF